MEVEVDEGSGDEAFETLEDLEDLEELGGVGDLQRLLDAVGGDGPGTIGHATEAELAALLSKADLSVGAGRDHGPGTIGHVTEAELAVLLGGTGALPSRDPAVPGKGGSVLRHGRDRVVGPGGEPRVLPRVVVLVPTQELVYQVLEVIKGVLPGLGPMVQVPWPSTLPRRSTHGAGPSPHGVGYLI